MDFSISDDHRAIREGVNAVVKRFGDDYWLARDEDGEFPREFHQAMAGAGWLGITQMAKFPPDGYTIGLTISNIIYAHALYTKLPFDIQKDFEPVSMAKSISIGRDISEPLAATLRRASPSASRG